MEARKSIKDAKHGRADSAEGANENEEDERIKRNLSDFLCEIWSAVAYSCLLVLSHCVFIATFAAVAVSVYWCPIVSWFSSPTASFFFLSSIALPVAWCCKRRSTSFMDYYWPVFYAIVIIFCVNAVLLNAYVYCQYYDSFEVSVMSFGQLMAPHFFSIISALLSLHLAKGTFVLISSICTRSSSNQDDHSDRNENSLVSFKWFILRLVVLAYTSLLINYFLFAFMEIPVGSTFWLSVPLSMAGWGLLVYLYYNYLNTRLGCILIFTVLSVTVMATVLVYIYVPTFPLLEPLHTEKS